jgi:sporulation protein YlmC with PRC-barrel domain
MKLNSKNTVLIASTLFKSKVLGEDKKKLGTVVNVLFDTKFLEARMLVFPDEQTKWLIRKILDSGEEITKEIIEGLQLPFAEKTNEIIEEMVKKGGKKAFKIANEYLTEMEEKLKKIYYLVPISDIVKVGKEETILASPTELYAKQSCNMDTSENDVVLYGANAITDVTSLWPITLNLVKIRGEIANDVANKPGRIVNLQLNPDEGIVSNLIIQTIGKGAGKHLVKLDDFDFSTLTTKSKFEEYPTLI